MTVCVRRATFADVERMLPLTEDLHKYLELGRLAHYDRGYMELFLSVSIHDDDKLALVAEQDGNVLGMMIAHTLGHWWSPSKLYAQELMYWVRPQYRHLGSGAEMLSRFDDWVKERGLDMAGMSSSGIYQREKLEKLFRGLGYVEESVIFMKRV